MAPPERTTRDMVLALTSHLSLRALRGRRDDLGMQLSTEEEQRLAELERVYGGNEPSREQRASFLLRVEDQAVLHLPVEFRRESGEAADGMLCSLTAGGFFVETPHPRRPGDEVTIKFVDLAAGRVWQFGGQVQWCREGACAGMALRFSGIPLEVRLSASVPPQGPIPAAA